MNNRFKLPTAKFKFLVFLALACTSALAQEPASWRVLIEPLFMRPPVSRPIPQAEKTVLAAAYLKDGEPVLFSRERFEALRCKFPEFAARALQNASSKTLKAEFIRDQKQVIECALLHSEDPLTATAVLAPEFYKKFVEIFGPNFLVAVPNRFSIYVFPALASKYRDYANKVLAAYNASPYPVSLEVFEVSERGLKAIGTYENN